MKNQYLIAIVLIICMHLGGLTACGQGRIDKGGSNGGKEQVGNVIYVAPSNWEKVENNGQIIYVAPKSNNQTVITILPGEQNQENLRGWFEAFLEKVKKGKQVVEGGEIKTANSDEGYDVFFSQVVLKAADGSLSYQFYVVAHPGDRIEAVGLISTDLNQFNQYQGVFNKFIESIDFANVKNTNPNSNNLGSNSRSDKSNTAKNNSNSSGLNGLYVGRTSTQQYNFTTKLYDFVVRQEYYLFAPGGKVYFGLPKGDIKNIDLACQQQPSNCGSYALASTQLQLNRKGQVQSFTLEKTDNGFKLGKTRFYKVGSFDGLKLNGLYSFKSFVNLDNPTTGTSGGVGGERAIAFDSDGNFVSNRFVGSTINGANAGVSSSEKSSREGKYQISGNILTLTYSNGGREQFSFFVYPENEQETKPGVIVIGGVAYLLRK